MKTRILPYALTLCMVSLLTLAACDSASVDSDFDARSTVSTQSVGGPFTGAIHTTDVACDGVDLNIYDAKEDVYLDGGPRREGAAGLPDASYYVRVTEPDGTLLGTSIGSGNDTPAVVVGGEFEVCYQLWDILIKASDSSQGYDDTSNPGGVYKVWVSQSSDFEGSASKTDNFKVLEEGETPPEDTWLRVRKYYDANANGEHDMDEVLLDGWLFNIVNGIDVDRATPVDMIVDPDTYDVIEYLSIVGTWINTDPGDGALTKSVTLAEGDDEMLYFGNVCLGPGGGKTLGFWSNKNGERTMGRVDGGMTAALGSLSDLNLVDADGDVFDPASYDEFRTWLLRGNATNMAYMLSVQLAAMHLNVLTGGVDADAVVYSADLGFTTIADLMAAADASLGTDPYTPSGDDARDYQEQLKDALDDANNNLNFVQPEACPYSFEQDAL